MRTSNPSLREDTFNKYAYLTGADPQSMMTVRGTLNKTLLLLAAVVASSFVSGAAVLANGAAAGMPWMLGGAIGGLAVALVVIFKPTTAPILAPVYALLEGCLLGSLSVILNKQYPGIPIQALAITFGVTFAMLLAYQNNVIRATPMFRKVVVTATCGIALAYLMSLGLMFFGQKMPLLNDATPIGIGISLFILVVASLNLVLDFDLIEKGANQGAPKFMEWYGAFSLLVTLVWLYIEALRLLQKLRR